jgi:hypothetical protein
MKTVKICTVVRVYDEKGTYSETRYDNVSCENIPRDIMKELLDGEVICVNVTPNVKAFYFDKTRETETLNNRKENKNNE